MSDENRSDHRTEWSGDPGVHPVEWVPPALAEAALDPAALIPVPRVPPEEQG